MELTIGKLKKILNEFEDYGAVSVFLKLHDEDYPEKHFGIVYEIENWGNNNGNLDLWISDSLNQFGETIQTTKKCHGE